MAGTRTPGSSLSPERKAKIEEQARARKTRAQAQAKARKAAPKAKAASAPTDPKAQRILARGEAAAQRTTDRAAARAGRAQARADQRQARVEAKTQAKTAKAEAKTQAKAAKAEAAKTARGQRALNRVNRTPWREMPMRPAGGLARAAGAAGRLAGPVAAAGLTGYGIGSAIYKATDETPFMDAVGGTVNAALRKLGIGGQEDALDVAGRELTRPVPARGKRRAAAPSAPAEETFRERRARAMAEGTLPKPAAPEAAAPKAAPAKPAMTQAERDAAFDRKLNKAPKDVVIDGSEQDAALAAQENGLGLGRSSYARSPDRVGVVNMDTREVIESHYLGDRKAAPTPTPTRRVPAGSVAPKRQSSRRAAPTRTRVKPPMTRDDLFSGPSEAQIARDRRIAREQAKATKTKAPPKRKPKLVTGYDAYKNFMGDD